MAKKTLGSVLGLAETHVFLFIFLPY